MEGSNMSPGEDSGIGFKISSEVMVAAVIFLFLVVIFVFFLYLYAKNYWSSSLAARSRAHFVFAAGDAPIPGRGLDVSVIRSLPLTVFKRSDFKDGLECSVCLCELSDGEDARLLPKCNHGFHLNCIDMWFHSHSTCPICRCAVGQEASPATGEELPPLTTGSAIDGAVQPESPAFPTNVLFWGNQDRVNTGGSFPQQVASGPSPNSARTLVISLPNRMLEGFPSPISPLPSSRFPSDNLKSPAEEARSPGASKFRSLRRLWSRGKRTNGSSCSSPMGGDIEQGLMGYGIPNGEGSSNVPKTPTGSFSPVALR